MRDVSSPPSPKTRFAAQVGTFALALSLSRGATATTAVQWTSRQDPSPFGGRAWHAAAYDSVRHVTVMFGGLQGSTVKGDTWEWEGTTWKLGAPEDPTDPNRPSPRYGTAMAYDPVGRRTILFGGRDKNNLFLGDTFAWDGVKWSALTVTGPPARYGHGMVYHASIGKMVLFGGGDGSPTALSANDTWGFDGTQWKTLSIPGPDPRATHVLVYDSLRQRTVMFGGFVSVTKVLGDTWEFDGSGWKPKCTPTPCPISGRWISAAAFDSQQGRVVLYGGVDVSGTTYEDTVLWDGATWSGLTNVGASASARGLHALAFDAARDRTVMVGGHGQPGDFADTRESLFSGQPCSSAAQCDTGFCVDGVCCRDACTGLCRHCDLRNPFYTIFAHANVFDGVCRNLFGTDPDKECLGELACGAGVCKAGHCDFAGSDTTCGLCAACNPATGRCDQLPAGGDDVNCPPARCGLASHVCRTFLDQSNGIRRCLDVGKCGWRWEDCSDFQDLDGTPCKVLSGSAEHDGTCAAGLCITN